MFPLTCFLVITRQVRAAPCCFLKRWHLCLCSTVGGSAWPLRWRSQQSHVLHVNRRSAQFQGPRLSEHKSHQTTLGPEKTSTAHANVLRFGFPQQRCGAVWCVHTVNCNDSECSLQRGGPAKLNKTTTNCGYSDDLGAGSLLLAWPC